MSTFSLQGNWIDLLILVVILYFVTEAFRFGFWVVLADFLSFLFSIVTALFAYRFASDILVNNFSLPHSVGNALGFLIIAIASNGIFGYLLSLVLHKIPKKYFHFKWDKFVAVLPAIGEALVLITFILTLILSLPLGVGLKKDISESKIGGSLVESTSGFNARLGDIFGKAIEDSLTYLTVRPGSDETVVIPGILGELTIDQESEGEMFRLVNQVREKNGLNMLTWNIEANKVARDYAWDMWERKYFGHYSPEGEDVGDRLDKAEIEYSFAGENLALAPSVQVAHAGLLNSDSHRENILHPRFRTLGIGVVENGIYGKIFVQIFTD